ncbi:MAG: IS30 family transposase [Gammaproteobacteria bacterium]|nr:IS30 family transposase [Gammaproteobacteria bacterium]
MKYKQITSPDRYIISALRKQGFSTQQIANHLGRHKSTIYRELKRNGRYDGDSHYRAKEAHARAIRRRSTSRRNQQYTELDYVPIRKLLRSEWSPEQITGYLIEQQGVSMSHETIYRYIWRDKANGGSLWTNLRQSLKQRRKRYSAYDSRGRLAGKRHISDRPKSVEGRRYKGHWEIDTVMGSGSKDCIVTLVERKTGFTMIGKLKDRTTASLNKRTISLINRDLLSFKSITADNGTEFHQYEKIEDECLTKFYFATPYHSWERGTNENTNGLIRQYLPKGESMSGLTQQKCDSIANKLNTRPRKRLGFKTPEECFYDN